MQISFGNTSIHKQSIQRWVHKNFDHGLVLDSNGQSENCEMLVAAGIYQKITIDKKGHFFDELKQFYDKYKCWLFGYLGYDLKNETESFLHSDNIDGLGFPDSFCSNLSMSSSCPMPAS